MKVSRRTFYRRRARVSAIDQLEFSLASSQILSGNSVSTDSQSTQSEDVLNDTTQSSIDLSNPNDLLPEQNDEDNDDEEPCRRTDPTLRDLAASAIIFKNRKQCSNADIDTVCNYMHALGVSNYPVSWKSIKKRFDLNPLVTCSNVLICNSCGQIVTNANVRTCSACQSHVLVTFYHYSLVEQLQQVLLIPGIYQRMKKQRETYMNDLKETRYAQILAKETNNAFTMTINIDGVVTKNKNLSLWPITFMINEIPLPCRRYSESILVGGAITPTKHPSNKLFQTILDILVDDLIQLENGIVYLVPNEQKQQLKFFLVGSCTDKPAQSLITNMVASNACFSCPKCLIEGENFHGESHRKRQFNVKVFPFGFYPSRSIDDYELYATNAASISNPMYGYVGLCPLTKLKYYSIKESVLFDSLHTLYLGVFKKLCLLWFSHSKDHRRQKWSLFSKIDSIDEGLAAVRIPTTTNRRFRSVKEISKFKANELRSLMHQGSTVLLQAMQPKYRKHFALLLAAVNTASKDTIQAGDILFIREALKKFVQDWQHIFGLRHMTSNVHSLLHLHESIASMGPLYMYSTFSFEAIGHDLVSMTHGTTCYGQQLMINLFCYREAIIETAKPGYPLKLFDFTQQLLSRKSNKDNAVRVQKKVDNSMYADELERIELISDRTFILYEQLIIHGVVYKTWQSTRSKKFSDCCVSFKFGSAVKFGFIRAVLQDGIDEDKIYVLLEDLVDDDGFRAERFLQVKITHNQTLIIPHIYMRTRSDSFILRSPGCILKKNAYRILSNSESIEIIEYSNLKESS